MKYLILLGAFQALVVFSIFIINKKWKSSDRILSWFLVWVFIHLGSGFLLHTIFPHAEIHKGFYTFISLIYAPLLWLYAAQLSGRHQRLGRKAAWLFLPALLAAMVYFTIAGYVIVHRGVTPPLISLYNKTIGYAGLISFPVFGILSLMEVRHIPAFWLSEKQLVRFMTVIMLILSGLMVGIMINDQLPPAARLIQDTHLWGRIFTYSFLLSICLAIGRVRILALAHAASDLPLMNHGQELLSPKPALLTESAAPTEIQRKSVLTTAQQARMAEDIKRVMETQGLYTDPELTLDKLAAAMEISRHHISETLNQHLGMSFYQFINEYRIREVIKLIDANKAGKDSPNLLSLAFEAGFHSKSSFNQYFKKVTGLTPSAYLKSKNTVNGYTKKIVDEI
jgi:AraC-like DNA-binding protein